MTKKVGKSGGTWAHWQIALGYAKYLDHGFHMWCNEVVREQMEGTSQNARIPEFGNAGCAEESRRPTRMGRERPTTPAVPADRDISWPVSLPGSLDLWIMADRREYDAGQDRGRFARIPDFGFAGLLASLI